MSRRTPPDHTDPKATAGLTARRRAKGLPVGRIEPRPETQADVDRHWLRALGEKRETE